MINNLIEEITQSDMDQMSGPLHRTVNELAQHLSTNDRTIQQEYELVQQKKSHLSRRLRDFVIMLIETEKLANDNNTDVIDEKVHTRESASDKIQ